MSSQMVLFGQMLVNKSTDLRYYMRPFFPSPWYDSANSLPQWRELWDINCRTEGLKDTEVFA